MRGAVAARGAGRQVVLAHLAGLAQRRAPSGRRSGSAPRPWKPCVASSAPRSVGIAVRGDHDRRVGEDPAGGHVALRRRSRRAPPTAPRTAARRAPPAHPVHARTYAATASTRGGRLEAAAGGRTPGAPTRPCRPRSSSAAMHVAQLDEHLDVERGVLQPRLGQRARRPVDRGVLLAHPAARAAPRPGWRGRRAGSRAGGRRARCRRGCVGSQADLGAGRAGPGWRRAGSTRRRRAPPASGARSSNAIGSTSAGAGALAAQLDQVGAGGVAVAGRPLGVDGDRTGAGGERGARPRRAPASVSTTRGRPSRSVEQRAPAGCLAARQRSSVRPARVVRVGSGSAVVRSSGIGQGRAGRVGWASRPRPRAPAAARRRCRAARPTPRRARSCRGAVLADVGRPGGADLDLGGAGLVGHPAEALGGDAGDGAGRRRGTSAPWASSASVSQVQPTAASIGSVTSSGSISARA